MRRSLVLSMVCLTIAAWGCGRAQPAGDATAATARQPGSGAASTETSPATAHDPQTFGQSAAAKPSEPEAPPDPAVEVFETLVRAYRDGDPQAWESADERLSGMGREAVPVLADALRHSERERREMAAMFLARLGPDAEGAADVLLAAVEDESVLVRANAASVLSLLYGPFDAEGRGGRVVSALAGLLDESDSGLQRMAIIALGNFGPQAEPAIPRLVELLADADAETQAAAASTLGRIGPAAADAVAALESLKESEEPMLRTAALEALRQIRDSEE